MRITSLSRSSHSHELHALLTVLDYSHTRGDFQVTPVISTTDFTLVDHGLRRVCTHFRTTQNRTCPNVTFPRPSISDDQVDYVKFLRFTLQLIGQVWSGARIVSGVESILRAAFGYVQ